MISSRMSVGFSSIRHLRLNPRASFHKSRHHTACISRALRSLDVIRDARIRTRQLIEDVIEWDFGIFATGFAAGNQALRLMKSCSIN